MKIIVPVQAAASVVRLRPHQEEAVEAIVRALTPLPGLDTPNGLRTTAVLPTGTGKSFIGAAAAQRLAPHGVVLVVVPTLDLLIQMVGSWRKAGRGGEMLAVCSLIDRALPVGVRATTNPLQLAIWLDDLGEREPVTVFATYASAGAIADAHRLDSPLVANVRPWALMIMDEAHRSSGSWEKSWAIVHGNAAMPALRRLYMTATPRIWEPPAVRRDDAYQPLPAEQVCSMDDRDVYGTVSFRLGLAEAVDRGLMAPFQIICLELRDPVSNPELAALQPIPWGAGVGESSEEDRVRPAHVAAVQAALLTAMAQENLGKVITFHSRTLEARYFAETLNQTAERLHAQNPDECPPEVWSNWLSGEHGGEYRAELLAEFGTTAGPDEEPVLPAVLANCRVLGEGIDIAACSGILLQGRQSMIDIVQAIGRALRMTPGEGKIASILVPVFLAPGEDPGALLTSDSYLPLVRVLTALRAHDARVIEQLAVPQRSGKRTTGRSAVHVAAPGEGELTPDGAPSFQLPVRFLETDDADALALLVGLRVLTGEHQMWREGIEAARAWHQEMGDLVVPVSTVIAGTNFPLGQWIADRRREYGSGDLAGFRIDQLDDLDMVWSMPNLRFETGLQWAAAWAKEHGGSLAAPKRAYIGGFGIGWWLSAQRVAAGAAGSPDDTPDAGGEAGPGAGEEGLSAERRAALEAIDPYWCPVWPVRWQRSYTAARLYLEAGGGALDELAPDVVFEEENIGRWIPLQRAGWAQLADEQRELLVALGVTADLEAVAARAAKGPVKSKAQRFQQGLHALGAFVAREGHARVPRAHKEPLEGSEGVVALGAWVNNAKARRAKLTGEQVAALEVLGMVW